MSERVRSGPAGEERRRPRAVRRTDRSARARGRPQAIDRVLHEYKIHNYEMVVRDAEVRHPALTLSLTHSPSHSLTRSLAHSLTRSLARSLR